jgi:hypothetical protein
MEVAIPESLYLFRDQFTYITLFLTISQTSNFLRTCKTYYNFYHKGISSKMTQKIDYITAEQLSNIYFDLNRYMHEQPKQIITLSDKSYIERLVFYAKTNNIKLFNLFIDNENDTHFQKRLAVLKAFKYTANQNNMINNMKAFRGISESNDDRHLYFLDSANANNYTALKILLKNNVNINFQSRHTERTALHYAVKNKNIKIVRFLLKNGANPNLREKARQITPLYRAVLNNNITIASLLLQNNANINARHQRNRTCIHKACLTGSEDMVKLLLAYNANIYLLTNHEYHEYSTTDCAKNYPNIVRLLSLWEKDHPRQYYKEGWHD